MSFSSMFLSGPSWPREDENQDTRLWDRLNISFLMLLLCLTRLPYLGIAEPDSSLFVIGAKQWLHQGPGALMIYSGKVCATYYALVVNLARALSLNDSALPNLMSFVSFLACVGTILVGYSLGLRIVSRQAAFWAMVLFSLSPGLWWTSIEPHPQVPSLFFALLSVWMLGQYIKEQPRIIWLLLAALSLGIGVALKNDAVLLVPGLLGVAVFLRPKWKTLLPCVAVVVTGALVSLLLGRVVLGAGSSAFRAGQQTATSVLGLPGPVELLKQATPILLGLGLLCCFLLAISLVRLAREQTMSYTWWLLIILWCLPGYVFYLLVSGNNIRHVVAFGIPLFWLMGRYIQPRYILLVAVAAFIIPGNSNMIMYPSPNVPMSYALFRRKQQIIAQVSQELRRTNSCFAGSYTNDYITADLLAGGGSIVEQSDVWNTKVVISMPFGQEIQLRRIDPTQRFLKTAPCRSLEYDDANRKFRFLGSEWKLPMS